MSDLDLWLGGIVEDTPIPFEIKNIIFFYDQNGKVFSLGMGGVENTPKTATGFEFFPKEAEFCFEKQLLSIQNEEYFRSLAKSMIDECFFDKNLKTQFAGKKIYFGKLNEDVEYLFTIV